MSESQNQEWKKILDMIDQKITPQTQKVPQLEKSVTEVRNSIEELRKSVESSQAQAAKKEAERVEQEAKSGRRGITNPEVALPHYLKCDTCRPKFEQWLQDNGYEKPTEPTGERKRTLGF